MQEIMLYRYARPDGGMTNSPVKPDCDYTVRYRLIADEGKMLTNGTDTTDCADVDSPDEWQEITKESNPDEIINDYETALAEIREKAALVNQLYSGEITIDAVPAEWQEEIQRRVDERIAAEGSAEEQDISAEEALEILLGGAT